MASALDPRDVSAALDAAFGKGASRRVVFDCRAQHGRRLYMELRISLEGEITDDTPLRDLIMAARPVRRGIDGECYGAEVDQPGL